MIVLDTSVLVASFTGQRPLAIVMHDALSTGERLIVPSLVLYEWLRGTRRADELETQDVLFPREEVVPFGPLEADLSAQLYRTLPRARERELDIAIAASAITRGAELWTLNPADFSDIPGLRLAVVD